jgi:hypothetical protein
MGVKLVSSGGGSVEINPPATASNFVATMPAGTGNVVVNGINSAIVSGTAVASTSGTSIDFTGIPSWVKRVTVMFNGVSTNGTSNIQIQIGDSGGIETTSYVSGAAYAGGTNSAGDTTSTTGFVLTAGLSAASALNGIAVICNHTSNTWTESFSGAYISGVGAFAGGYKTLSDTLTQVRITTVGGTNTFDAGSINILYE